MDDTKWGRHLAEALSSYQQEGYLCDLHILANDGRVFMAHTCVVSAASGVLKSTIDQCRSDPSCSVVTVTTTLSSEILPDVLRCIYTGSIQVELKLLDELKEALEQLDIKQPGLETEKPDDEKPVVEPADTAVGKKSKEMMGSSDDDDDDDDDDEADNFEELTVMSPGEIKVELPEVPDVRAQSCVVNISEDTEHDDDDDDDGDDDDGDDRKPSSAIQIVTFTKNEDGKWACPACIKTFTNQSHLRTHYRIHTKELPFKCEICDKGFSQNSGLLRHMQSVHLKLKPHKCVSCEKAFSERSKLKLHCILVHPELDPEECLGKQGSPNKSNPVKETSADLSEPMGSDLQVAEESPQRPKQPDAGSTQQKGVKLQTEVTDQEDIDLDEHVSQTPATQPVTFTKNEDGKWECPICVKTFADKSHLRTHYRIHTKELPFKCEICDKGFAQSSGHLRHMQTVHLKLKPHKCTSCDKAYSERSKLKLHCMTKHPDLDPEECLGNQEPKQEIIEDKSNPGTETVQESDSQVAETSPKPPDANTIQKGADGKWSCASCSKSFRYRSHLACHLKTHKQSNFPCSICSKSFIMQSNLTRHMNAVHKGLKPHKCSYCDRAFSQLHKMKTHEMEIHNPNATVYHCRVCPKKFKSKEVFRKHTDSHSDARPRQCDVCGKSFRGNCQLSRHIRCVHENKRPFACPICPKTYKEKAKLREHMNIHTEGVTYDCDKCSKKFTRRSERWRHNRTAHMDGRPHHCQVCNKSFKLKAQVNVHMRHVHHGVKDYRCQYCSKCFTSATCLKVHEHVHTGAKPYKCAHCFRGFNQRGALTVHERRAHTGDRPYPCRYCNKTYVTSYERNEHEGKHMETKRYICSLCPRRFPGSANLHMHMLTHSTVRRHKCEVCSKAYKTKSHLDRHRKSHAGSLIPGQLYMLCDIVPDRQSGSENETQ